MPAVLIYEQITGSALISEHVRFAYGWISVWNTSIWTGVYCIYYSIVGVAGLYILYDYRKKTDNAIIKRQSLILLVSGAIVLAIGSLVNVVLQRVMAHPIPMVADSTALVWALALAYVSIKYNMLNITPFLASQQIVTAMKDLLFLLDTHGRIISINPAARETLECGDERLIGRPFIDVIIGTEPQRSLIAETIKSSPAFIGETMLGLPSGHSIPASLSTSLIADTGIVCVAHDISLQKQRTELLHEAKKRLESEVSRATDELQKANARLTEEILERKQAALTLMETEEKFRVIYSYAPDGIFLVDLEGNFIEGNNEARRIIAYDENELRNKNLFDTGTLSSADYDKISAILAENRLGKASSPSELTVLRKDRTVVPVEIIAHPIKIGDRNLVLGVVRDLTQRKKAEQEAEELRRELHQAQKMEAIGRLAGGIAHDFNNLLGGLMGYAGLLRKKLLQELPAEVGVVQKIIDITRQAADHVTQLLAFARKGKYQIAPVVMHEVIDEVVGLLEHTIDRKITLVRNYRASSSTVMGDRSQLHSALLNLGVNARDALPGGGVITFSTDIETIENELAHTYPYAIEPGIFLKITIADNGVGMDEKTRSRAFEPFFSTKDAGQGTGLGLASVYGTIKHHSGFIELRSEPGKGSTFTIYLPFSIAKPDVHHTEKEKKSLAPFEQCHGAILIVEDDPVIREIALESLGDLGYTVNTCSDGAEALAWYREHHLDCDLVIMDLIMPKLSGKECLRAMKEIAPSMKAIIASGHTMDNEIGELLAEGALAFLQKPYEIEQLAEAVQKALK